MLFSPVLTFAAVLVTPDTPLLTFWALYLVWLIAIHERLALGKSLGWWWLLGGIFLGCGVLGKYMMGACRHDRRRQLPDIRRQLAARWVGGYILHAVVAMLVASPILIHNIQHDFAPIRYQWGHSMSSPNRATAIRRVPGRANPPLRDDPCHRVCAWVMWRAKRIARRSASLRVCLCLFVLPFAFFMLKATQGRIEGNWAFPCYLACWPLAAEWYGRVRESARWRAWATAAGFLCPLGVSAFFLVHLIEPLPLVPAESDRPTRQWERLALCRAIARDLTGALASPVLFTHPTYQVQDGIASVARYRCCDKSTTPCCASHFTGARMSSGQREIRGLVFVEAPQQPKDPPGLGAPRAVWCYPLVVRGVSHDQCWLLDYSDPSGKMEGPETVAGTRHLDQHPR